MKKRVLSVLVLFAIIAATMPFRPTRILFFMAAGMLCAYEYAKNLRDRDIKVTRWVLFAYLAIQAVLAYTNCGRTAYLAWFTAAVYVSLFSGILHKDVSGKGAVYTVSVLAYPCFPFALMMIIASSDRWLATLLLSCLATWICDSFALFGGMLFGKHKIAPDVSPNKTIEGCLTGALFSLLGGVISYFIINSYSSIPMWQCLVVAFVSSTLGQIGDLAESLIKRYLEIKDFSNLIPGHGGMFDRADSLMFAIPTAYFLLYFFSIF